MITHNLGIVAQFCSRIYVMYAGKMVEHADTHNLFHRPCTPTPGDYSGRLSV